MEKHYDIVVIGGGPSGLTAGIYSARAGLKTLIMERAMTGGRATSSHLIENYPGFPDGVGGFELGELMRSQAQKSGADFYYGEALKITDNGSQKIIKTSEGDITSKAVVLATGTRSRKLGLKDEEELIGRGISYCATCDGAFFKGKEVAIVGGGNSAVSEAIYLSGFVKHVHLVHRRDQFRAEQVRVKRLKEISNVTLHLNAQVAEFIADDLLKGIIISTPEGQKTLEVSGLFIAIGQEPVNELVKDLDGVKLDEYGGVKVDCHYNIGISGVYACGDIVSKNLRQVINAAGEGAEAANSAIEYVNNLN